MKLLAYSFSLAMILFSFGCSEKKDDNSENTENVNSEMPPQELSELEEEMNMLISHKLFDGAIERIDDIEKWYPQQYEELNYDEARIEIENLKIEHAAEGDWETDYFLDKSGNQTENIYLTNESSIEGNFSNSETKKNYIKADVYYDYSGQFEFKLFELGSELVNHHTNTIYNATVRFKNNDSLLTVLRTKPDLLSFSLNESKLICDELEKGNPVRIFIEDSQSPENKYDFNISRLKGFAKAYKKVNESTAKED